MEVKGKKNLVFSSFFWRGEGGRRENIPLLHRVIVQK
jgi:hypothetical protein